MSSNVVRGEKPGNYLLVEGDDDEHVFYSLLEHYRVPDQFKIENKNGVNKLIDELDAELDRSGLARLGIVVDADADLKARWISLRDKLIKSGYSRVPIDPQQSGTIIQQDGRPIVGTWLMPDNRVSGMFMRVKPIFTPGLPGKKNLVSLWVRLLLHVISMLTLLMLNNSWTGFASYLI